MKRARKEDSAADKEDKGMVDCPTCDGSGKVRGGKVTCPDCHGESKLPAEKAESLKAAAADEEKAKKDHGDSLHEASDKLGDAADAMDDAGDAEDDEKEDKEDAEADDAKKAADAQAGAWYGVMKRNFDAGVGGGMDRDKIPAEDFAGPNRTFPIVSQSDVEDAHGLAGHADDPDAVRSKIRAIADRKGLKPPKAEADKGDKRAAKSAVKKAAMVAELGATIGSLQKEGRAISRSTAAHIESAIAALAAGRMDDVKASLVTLKDLAARHDAGPGNDGDAKEGPTAELREGDDAARGDLKREKLEIPKPPALAAPEGAESMSLAGPDGIEAGSKSFRAELLKAFAEDDTLMTKLAEAATAKEDSRKALKSARKTAKAVESASGKVTRVEAAMAELREEFTAKAAEIDRIKELPQPSKGVVSEDLVRPVEKGFAANGGVVEPAQTSDHYTVLVAKAASGDLDAQRILREVAQAGGGSDEMTKRVYTASMRGTRR